jgi:predicted SprT family Zn-dependent metalloprotease
MTVEQITQLFKSEAAKHGFDLPIKTDRSRKRIAGCAHIGPVPMYFTFSAVLMPLMSEAEMLDTIRHEIAHAQTPEQGHGPAWKLAAMAIGANPSPCTSLEITAKQAGYKYIAACVCAPDKHGKTRMPKRSFCCGLCRTHLVWVQQY